MAAPTLRTLHQRLLPEPHRQGGALIHQTIGSQSMPEFMPFLLLDDLETKGKTDGFGDHPHQGQETMTYLLEGKLVHQDSKGNSGVLHAGDLQTMRAGKGIMHSEDPLEDPITNGTKGIQLWVALPEANLKDDASYQDVLSSTMPVATPAPGVRIKVISGSSFSMTAPLLTCAPVWYFDVSLERGSKIQHELPKTFNVFAHILSGSPTVAGHVGKPHETMFMARDGDAVELKNTGPVSARLLLIAGDPLEGQDVHRMGPFVSTSSAGVQRAILDFRADTNGFEGSRRWKSKAKEDIVGQRRNR